VKLGFAQLDAGGFEFIDELEQLLLPADELGARLPAAAIRIGQVSEVVELFGRRREVAWPALSAIGEDGAGVKFAAVATAGRLAALPPQGVQGARQEGLATEAKFEQGGQALLGQQELGAEGAESLVHQAAVEE
jgi:hypothetical protein